MKKRCPKYERVFGQSCLIVTKI